MSAVQIQPALITSHNSICSIEERIQQQLDYRIEQGCESGIGYNEEAIRKSIFTDILNRSLESYGNDLLGVEGKLGIQTNRPILGSIWMRTNFCSENDKWLTASERESLVSYIHPQFDLIMENLGLEEYSSDKEQSSEPCCKLSVTENRRSYDLTGFFAHIPHEVSDTPFMFQLVDGFVQSYKFMENLIEIYIERKKASLAEEAEQIIHVLNMRDLIE